MGPRRQAQCVNHGALAMPEAGCRGLGMRTGPVLGAGSLTVWMYMPWTRWRQAVGDITPGTYAAQHVPGQVEPWHTPTHHAAQHTHSIPTQHSTRTPTHHNTPTKHSTPTHHAAQHTNNTPTQHNTCTAPPHITQNTHSTIHTTPSAHTTHPHNIHTHTTYTPTQHSHTAQHTHTAHACISPMTTANMKLNHANVEHDKKPVTAWVAGPEP